MTTFLTLLKTEYIKRKNTYWLPIWIIGGLLVLILFVSLIALLSPNPDINLNISDLMDDTANPGSAIRIAVYAITLGLAWIFAFFMVMTAQNSLSKEKELGCELFYHCQPVNIWLNTASKYTMHVLASAVGIFAVGLVIALVTSSVGIVAYGTFNIFNGIYGAFLALLTYMKICLVFGSLFFLFSGVFNGNSFLKGLGALGILEGVLVIIEVIFRHTISFPSIFGSLFSLLGGMEMEFMDEITFAAVVGDIKVVVIILFAAFCYTSGTLLYKFKPIEA